jgi:CheY-like chemotaxis protein
VENHSVLVVEDDEAISEAIATLLEMRGYAVARAGDGKEALSALARMPRPCLILLDLMMPVMNGWEFLEAVKDDVALATIPVVAVTAFGDRVKDIEVRAVVKKPFELDALLRLVKQYC